MVWPDSTIRTRFGWVWPGRVLSTGETTPEHAPCRGVLCSLGDPFDMSIPRTIPAPRVGSHHGGRFCFYLVISEPISAPPRRFPFRAQTANAGAIVPVAWIADRASEKSKQARGAVHHGPHHAGNLSSTRTFFRARDGRDVTFFLFVATRDECRQLAACRNERAAPVSCFFLVCPCLLRAFPLSSSKGGPYGGIFSRFSRRSCRPAFPFAGIDLRSAPAAP